MSTTPKPGTLYDLLGLTMAATPRQVRAAHRALGLRALMLLAEGGDDLSIPRGIAHEINLPGRDAADAAKQKLAQMGYTIVSETSDASEDLPFRLAFQRVEAPEASALLTSAELLDQLAQELDGEYAGWECPPAG